jgi:hypothetical protein
MTPRKMVNGGHCLHARGREGFVQVAAMKPGSAIEAHRDAPSNVASVIEFIDSPNGKRNPYVAPSTIKKRLRNMAKDTR